MMSDELETCVWVVWCVVFVPFSVNTSDLIYEDCLCLIFLHVHHETSDLTGELREESDQFRYLPEGLRGFDFNRSLGNEGYYSPRVI